MEVFLLYLWLKIDTVRYFLSLIPIAVLLTYAISRLNRLVDRPHSDHYWVSPKWHAYAASVTLAFVILMPSANQTAALVAAHYAVKAASSPEADKVLTLLRAKANAYLDEQIANEVKK